VRGHQILIIICFIVANIFYFPWCRLERSVVTSEHIERLNGLKRKVIDDYDLSIDGNFKSEVIYFDVCSFSYKLFNIGYRGKELIFFVDYQKNPIMRTRHFIKVDTITPNFLLSFLGFSSYIVLMGGILWMYFVNVPNKKLLLEEMMK